MRAISGFDNSLVSAPHHDARSLGAVEVVVEVVVEVAAAVAGAVAAAVPVVPVVAVVAVAVAVVAAAVEVEVSSQIAHARPFPPADSESSERVAAMQSAGGARTIDWVAHQSGRGQRCRGTSD